ncbi:PglB [Proteiniclasticum sp. QWL-01]|uniref:PglD-related sugar-binding protein n=1 Tax=Proteiniclasticum sp. QWL-01 TaxID=3036945 RepID=UPI002410F484|nr:PglB [Proteiniclasticum sp. QWL-01]WFF74546.1 PglB [Proteiniclasticum sp. QWL-01]
MDNCNLVILGAGSHGLVVKETAEAMGIFDRIDFLDDSSPLAMDRCDEVGKYKSMYQFAFPAVGDNKLRERFYVMIHDYGFEIPILIHPSSYVSPSATIQKGVIVLPKAVVNTKTIIEKGSIVGPGAVIDHDSFIGAFAHVDAGSVLKARSKINAYSLIRPKFFCGQICLEHSEQTLSDIQ